MAEDHISKIEKIGVDKSSGRGLYLIEVSNIDEVPHIAGIEGRYFVTLIIMDAVGVPVTTIAELARHLIDAGGVYFCTWGGDCERVHDIIDEEWVGEGYTVETDPTIMTTWHHKELLAEAIGYALYTAFPISTYFDECQSVVAIVIDNQDAAEEVRSAFSNPDQFAIDYYGFTS